MLIDGSENAIVGGDLIFTFRMLLKSTVNCKFMSMWQCIVSPVPVFGAELGSQFLPTNMPAPTVVMKCVQAIEKEGFKTIGIHSIIPSGSEKNALRTALNQSKTLSLMAS